MFLHMTDEGVNTCKVVLHMMWPTWTVNSFSTSTSLVHSCPFLETDEGQAMAAAPLRVGGLSHRMHGSRTSTCQTLSTQPPSWASQSVYRLVSDNNNLVFIFTWPPLVSEGSTHNINTAIPCRLSGGMKISQGKPPWHHRSQDPAAWSPARRHGNISLRQAA